MNVYQSVVSLKTSGSHPFLIQYSTDTSYDLTFGSATGFDQFKVPLPTKDAWHHLAVVYDGVSPTSASSFKVYIDGTPQLVSMAGNYSGSATNNTIIGTTTGLSPYWKGLIDNIDIYKRALAPQEIATLAKRRGIAYETNSRKISAKAPPTHVIAPRRTLTYPQLSIGRVAAYSAGEQGPGGLTLYDQSGHGNDLALTNMDTGDWVDQALDYDGANDECVGADSPSLSITGALTLSTWINADALGFRALIEKGEGTTTTNSYYININSGGKLNLNLRQSPSIVDDITGTTTLSTGAWTHLAATYDGVNVRLYINGETELSTTTSVTSIQDTAAQFALGGIPNHAAWPFNGRMDDSAVYNRALAPQEIATLAEYRGIAYEMSHSPRIIDIYGPTSTVVVSEVTLIVQSTLHSHTSDNVVITQTHVLVALDATHAHAADNVDITQTHILTVADALHSQTVDNVTLTQTHVLTTQDALHSHTVDNVALTQTHELAVDDALHSHSVDNVALTQTHILVVADTLHAHTVDSITLTQTHALVVQDALHVHTVDKVVLTIIVATEAYIGLEDVLGVTIIATLEVAALTADLTGVTLSADLQRTP
jgi:hypothetical protein